MKESRAVWAAAYCLALTYATACDSPATGPTASSGLSLSVVLGPSLVAAPDAGMIRIRGDATRDVAINPGETKDIAVPPGSYNVALEGLAAGRVVRFGDRSGITVVDGQMTNVIITLQTFVPSFTAIPTEGTVGSGVAISWTPIEGAVSYDLEWSGTSDFSAVTGSQSVDGTSTTVSPASSGLLYFRVAARTGFGSRGAPSVVSSGTMILLPPPEAPSSVVAVAVSHQSIEVGWRDNSSNEARFDIYRETMTSGGAPAAAPVKVTEVAADHTTFRDDGLMASTTYSYTVQACNEAGCVPNLGESGTASSATVTTHGELAFNTETLPDGTIGVSYSQSISATGGSGTFQWMVEGALPPGVSLNDSTGVLVGTPTESGSFTFTLWVRSGEQSKSRDFTIIITEAVVPPHVTTSALPDAIVGVAYNVVLAASGGDGVYDWSLSSGTLPAGLSLSRAGRISGTPTTTETRTFRVEVTSAEMSGSAQLSIHVAPPPVATVTVSPNSATIGIGQQLQLTATTRDKGGNVVSGRPISWSSSSPDNASVSVDGRVGGVSVGSATITATSEGINGSASIAVVPSYRISLSRNGNGTVTSSPGGISCGADCEAWYASGTTVRLTSTADAGWLFVGWGGACASAGTAAKCDVDVSSDLAVTATFGAVDLVALDIGFDEWYGIGGFGALYVAYGWAQWPSSEDCTFDAYASKDKTLDPGDYYLTRVDVPCGSPPNSSDWVAGPGFFFPSSMLPGSYFALLVADPDDAVTEANETNNVTASSSKYNLNYLYRDLVVDIVGSPDGTVLSTPSGITCGGDCSEPFRIDEKVTLTAYPEVGYRIKSWGGACAGTSGNTCQVTVVWDWDYDIAPILATIEFEWSS